MQGSYPCCPSLNLIFPFQSLGLISESRKTLKLNPGNLYICLGGAIYIGPDAATTFDDSGCLAPGVSGVNQK